MFLVLEIVSSVRDRNCCFDFKSSLLPQNHKKALFVCHNLDCGKKKKKKKRHWGGWPGRLFDLKCQPDSPSGVHARHLRRADIWHLREAEQAFYPFSGYFVRCPEIGSIVYISFIPSQTMENLQWGRKCFREERELVLALMEFTL